MSIAQEIRQEAMGGADMSTLACSVLTCFEDESDHWSLMEMTHYRTFLLMVAEELSPSLPAAELMEIAEAIDCNWSLTRTERSEYFELLRDLVRGM